MPITIKNAAGDDVEVLTAAEQAEMITGAVRGQLEKTSKKLGDDLLKKLGDSVSETLKPIQEQIAKGAQVDTQTQTDPKASPEFAAMKRQLDEQSKVIEVERSARLEAEKKQRQDSARASVLSQIDAAVKPELKEFLGDYLFNRVEFDESGTPLIRVGGDEALPLKDGITSFLKSKEAGAFIPAPTNKNGPAGKSPQILGQRPNGTQQTTTETKAPTTDEGKARWAMEQAAQLESANVSR